ncbi:MAG: hypothetical protein ACFCU9_01675 [Cyanophyceae cyanobacterium]
MALTPNPSQAGSGKGGSPLTTHLQESASESSPPLSDADMRNLPLGQRLLRAGLLSRQQLAQALREQQQNHLRLGEICLEHGWIEPEDLYKFTASHELCLGEVLVAMGSLQSNQLRVALAQQRRFGRRLGEILAWKGWVGTDVLNQALDIQAQLKQMQMPRAWDALQVVLKSSASRPVAASSQDDEDDIEIKVPIPPHLQSLATREERILPPSAIGVARPDPSSTANGSPTPERQKTTTWGAPNPTSRIAELELELQLKEQEWKALTAQMETQVVDFQRGYEERIQYLENRLEEQEEQLQLKFQQEVQLRRLQTEIERLEKGFQQARQESQRSRRHLEQALSVREQKRAQAATKQAEWQTQLEASQAETQALAHKLEAQALEIQVLQFQIKTLEAQIESSGDPSLMGSGGSNAPLMASAPLPEWEQLRQQLEEVQTQLQEAETQREAQQRENHQLEGMVATYRQTIQALQNSIQQQSPVPAAAPASIAPVAASRPTSKVVRSPITSPPQAPPTPVPLTPWARNLFNQLVASGLIDGDGVERVMSQWQQGGGRLTQVIAQVTNLSPATIRFFCDGGSVARQAGCRRLGDFLVAAGLVPQEVIKTLRREGIWESLQQAQALVEQGILPQATVDYFLTQFVEDASVLTVAPSSTTAPTTVGSQADSESPLVD